MFRDFKSGSINSAKTKRKRTSGAIQPRSNQTIQDTLAGKVMTLFLDSRDPVLEHYLPRETTVTSSLFHDQLKNHLNPGIRLCWTTDVCCGLTTFWCITARTPATAIEDLHCECLPHPTYSPYLVSSDYRMSGQLLKAFGGESFAFTRKGSIDNARMITQAANNISFKKNPGISKTLEDVHWT